MYLARCKKEHKTLKVGMYIVSFLRLVIMCYMEGASLESLGEVNTRSLRGIAHLARCDYGAAGM